ncbi:hypothetical protein Nepgr_032269 [Nepenthes gracilis]|uniref:Uncharacterized protein n=1 Tax=Nepenthes gracilis TaxID=150966 RepID=A0AAD3TJZ9_NEPGR|nr:hypothetical protein Nepgr_032269 [Nepenthes gracilis]
MLDAAHSAGDLLLWIIADLLMVRVAVTVCCYEGLSPFCYLRNCWDVVAVMVGCGFGIRLMLNLGLMLKLCVPFCLVASCLTVDAAFGYCLVAGGDEVWPVDAGCLFLLLMPFANRRCSCCRWLAFFGMLGGGPVGADDVGFQDGGWISVAVAAQCMLSSRASVRSTISAPAKQQQKGPGIPANPPPSASLNVKLATNFQISESVEDIQHATGYISSAYLQQAPAASESCIEAHHCNPKQYQTMLLHLPQHSI